MAEVVGIIGSIGAIVNIIDATSKVITAISDLRARWKDADLSILSLASQLTTFRAALRRIQEWLDDEMPESHHQLVMDLGNTLSCCAVLVDRIDSLFSDLDSLAKQPMNAANRWKVVFGNKSVENVLMLVERQTNALALLLTACSCATISEQKRVLERAATRKAIQRAKTDTVSLIVHKDSSSLRSKMTDNLSKISLIFGFDLEVFSSDVYHSALRGSLKDLLRRRLQTPNNESEWIKPFASHEYADPTISDYGIGIGRIFPLNDKNPVFFNKRCGAMFDDCVNFTQHVVKRLQRLHHEQCTGELLRDTSSAVKKPVPVGETLAKDIWHHPLFESALGLNVSFLPGSHVVPEISGGLTVARFVVREFAALRLGQHIWQERLYDFCMNLREGCNWSRSRHFVENDAPFRLSLHTVWDDTYSDLTILLHWELAKKDHHTHSPSYLARQDRKFQFQLELAQLYRPKEVSYMLLVDGKFLSKFESASFPIAESFSDNPLNSTIADITQRFHEITPFSRCRTFTVWDCFIIRGIVYILREVTMRKNIEEL